MGWIDYRKQTTLGNYSFFGGSKRHIRKYTDKQVATMKKRVMNGETYRDIALDYGVTSGTIYNIIKRYAPFKREPIPSGYIQLKDFSENIGYSIWNIWHHVKTKNLEHVIINHTMYVPKNLKITNSKFIPEEKIDAIMDLFNNGMTRTDIAKKLGLNRNTVNNYVRLLK